MRQQSDFEKNVRKMIRIQKALEKLRVTTYADVLHCREQLRNRSGANTVKLLPPVDDRDER